MVVRGLLQLLPLFLHIRFKQINLILVVDEERQMADCPCKQTLNEGEKRILNFGLNNDMLRNPNAAAIGIARQLGGANSSRIAGLITSASAGGPTNTLQTALPALTRMRDTLQTQQNIVTAFENESNRFTNPRELVRTISSLSLFAEMNCALGIKGLDIGIGLNVVNENGQLSINYAVVANADLEQILNQFSSGLGTATADAVRQLQEGLNNVFTKMDAANNSLNSIMDEAAAMQNRAADFIQKYTSINSLANLINEANTDPCFKLGSTLNGSLVSPDFLNAVRGGTSTGFGGGGFR